MMLRACVLPTSCCLSKSVDASILTLSLSSLAPTAMCINVSRSVLEVHDRPYLDFRIEAVTHK
jgi:hypothetical protein